MRCECCTNCRYYQAVLVRVDVDEETGEEEPVFTHLCNGKRISEYMVGSFRCGNYEPRGMHRWTRNWKRTRPYRGSQRSPKVMTTSGRSMNAASSETDRTGRSTRFMSHPEGKEACSRTSLDSKKLSPS